ncbi:hypothetical protein [uncultured Roseobacter sp.]|uniref:hypothetical protein n=1 Tax=uncultured Roseobacter sp. TaxID=114847 RepID=UPI00260F413C|nr:hypothetical protein [uncultured Roseobacter sp.]
MKTDLVILKHSLWLIFAHPLQSLKVVAPGVLVFVGAIFLTGPAIFSGGALHTDALFSTALLLQFLLTLVAAVLVAVMWHRHALLQGERRAGVMRPPLAAYGRYIGYSVLIGLIVLAVYLPLGWGVGMVGTYAFDFFSNAQLVAGLLMGLVLVMVSMWLIFRLGLILPSAALNQPIGLLRSWQATRPAQFMILRLILLLWLLSIGLNVALTPVVHAFPLWAIPIEFGLSFVQMLAFLSLLSTLYAHLIEGRDLG